MQWAEGIPFQFLENFLLQKKFHTTVMTYNGKHKIRHTGKLNYQKMWIDVGLLLNDVPP